MSLLAGALLALVLPVAGPILTEVPAKPDPKARYVFYLHGRILETQGRHAVSADFGRYEYEAILAALAAEGATVIGEIRRDGAGDEFVDRVANAKDLTAKDEIVLTLGLDHGLLYKPYPLWIRPALAWIGSGPRVSP